MSDFVPGQRWISESETELGLGTLLTLEPRILTILYPSCGETRNYARHNHPLNRVAFSRGDRIPSHEGWHMVVERCVEDQGLLTYYGRDDENQERELPEACLDNFIQFNKPKERLLSGQIDKVNQFALRYRTLSHYNRTMRSSTLGQCGSRTSLIPHQLHIANEVSSRFAPRVLLADEVGLGKTIEAGMILYRQLLTGEAKRVLIIVPETLQHQWLVEMLRRFNLNFSLFDEERCQGFEDENPFDSAQLILCNMALLTQNDKRLHQALACTWDLLVVDEAHHLQWSETEPSREYQCIEALANNIPGVLLLTATPEQLGRESHFARLRLLDPDRYNDLSTFLDEEQGYQAVAPAVQQLLDAETLDETSRQLILEQLGDDDSRELLDNIGQNLHSKSRDLLVKRLLDRRGTSRVLFRNTRSAISGFPGRAVQDYPLELPELYQIAQEDNQLLRHLLYPDQAYKQFITQDGADLWWKFDPRVEWLILLLKEVKEKVLVICANADTALELDEALRVRSGTPSAVFHEGMSIIERDRAAAYFAENEYGAQVLICSEIGSEGRNFQFAHHLVMFDLPANPDLLEQRIGRLDRIGQQQSIRIHAPVFAGSAQERLYRWYHEGLNAFIDTCPAGASVFETLRDDLRNQLKNSDDAEAFQSLLDQTQLQRCTLHDDMHKGRDRLLELNSQGLEDKQQMIDEIKKSAHSDELKRYINLMCDCYGLETEDHSKRAIIIRPSDQALMTDFPGISGEAVSLTWDRDIALSREDLQFLSWEHPIVLGGMEMILSSEMGNTSVAVMSNKAIKPGTMLLEAIYVVEVPSNERRRLQRHLPPTAIRCLIDPSFNDLAQVVKFDALDAQLSPLKKATARQLLTAQRAPIIESLEKSELCAKQQADTIIEDACNSFKEEIAAELQRMMALKAVNPNIRDDELIHLVELAKEGEGTLRQAYLRLDGVRVIFAT